MRPGSRLGHYRIVAHLGSGGMGEVYRAVDTRAEREVAVKLLPRELARDADRLRRFEQEARAVGKISHPSVVALYHVGTWDGTTYLVTELLEGETLRKALRDGPLPRQLAVDCAAQIARGLAAAHEKGIVHRDLKPENVFLTRDGRAKILDFGLAKLARHDDPQARATLVEGESPSTEAGVVLGTVGYMAPEQVRGQPVDPKTDLFALGAVLYEMLTGRAAFVRGTRADTLSAILHEDPPEPGPPAPLDRLVRHCVEKAPGARFQSASDLAFALESLSGSSIAPPPADAVARGDRPWRRALPWALAAAAVIAALVSAALALRASRAGLRDTVRLTAEIAPAHEIPAGWGTVLTISPDGRRVVFAGRSGEQQRLFLRRLDRFDAIPIPGTEGATRPFFSPDGRWLGFVSQGNLWKIAPEGGVPIPVLRSVDPSGASWSSDGTLVLCRSWGEGLSVLHPADARLRPLTTLRAEANEGAHVYPEVLPGGAAALFTVWTKGSWEEARIEAVALASGERKLLVDGGAYGRYAASGHLLFSRGSTLFAVAFDPRRLEVLGDPAPVLDSVHLEPSAGFASYAVAADGTLVFLPLRPPRLRRMVWVDRQGREEPALEHRMQFTGPSLSPDGRRVATEVQGAVHAIWIHDLDSETRTRLTPEADAFNPVWSPDGERVVFTSNLGGPYRLHWRQADGRGAQERLVDADHIPMLGSFSPDGRWLLYTVEADPVTRADLWLLDLSGDRPAAAFLRTPADELAPEISPDGRWVAYASNETGRSEIFVAPFPGPGSPLQVSTSGGREVLWSPAGGELFFRSDGKMMRVAIDSGTTLRAGRPEVVFEGDYLLNPTGYHEYDVTRDAERFLMLRDDPDSRPAAERLVIVLNWFEQLKGRAPDA